MADATDTWQTLFDGRTTRGWRNYRRETISDGWRVVDGALTRVAEAGDVVTDRRFSDFDLRLEWRVKAGGNSGVFYRAGEVEPEIHMTAPEIQLLDDDGHPDGRDPLTSAGACYGLYPAPRGIVRPAGSWNSLQLLVEGSRVAQWLNGQFVARYVIGSADWQARVRESKFVACPWFGALQQGHIGLQDHGDWVAFRGIMIRELHG